MERQQGLSLLLVTVLNHKGIHCPGAWGWQRASLRGIVGSNMGVGPLLELPNELHAKQGAAVHYGRRWGSRHGRRTLDRCASVMC